MKTKQLLHTNYFLFLQDFVESIKEGYYVFPSNEGWLVESFSSSLIEITLFKMDSPLKDKMKGVKEKIHEYDSMQFLTRLQDYVLSGFNVEFDTLYWDRASFKSVDVILDEALQNKYTKEELDEMDWPQLQQIGRVLGEKHRDRRLLTKQILQKYEELD